MDQSTISKYKKNEYILKHIAFVYIIGAVLNVLQYFFDDVSLARVIGFSTLLLFIAVFVLLIPKISKTEYQMVNLLTIVLTLSIPSVIFWFLKVYGSNVVWPIPLLITMLTIFFNSKKMITFTAISSIVTGIAAWMIIPNLEIQLDNLDYISRIVFYGMCIVVMSYINKVYVLRLKEYDLQVGFQKLLTELSTEFLMINQKNYESKMRTLLRSVGTFTNSDRCYYGVVSTTDAGNRLTEIKLEWLSEGTPSMLPKTLVSIGRGGNWIEDQLRKKSIMIVTDVSELPIEAVTLRRMMEEHNIISLMLIPIITEDNLLGFIGLDQYELRKKWNIYDNEMIMVLSNIIAKGLLKIQTQNKVHHMAYYDSLTGLPNKVLLEDRIEHVISISKRYEMNVGLIYMDIDEFKTINDTLGHDVGDALLIQMSKRISKALDKPLTVSRVGGDEFIILIPSVKEMDYIDSVANSIRNEFSESFWVNAFEFFINVSMGISVYPNDGTEANELIRNADLAMYHSKKNGKDQITYCSSLIKEGIKESTKIKKYLETALENKELVVYYQPQVNTHTKEITGLEALLRWNHPELGFVSPKVFIPVAEETGLIHEIGEWVLFESCKQMKAWHNQGLTKVPIAVNVSIKQFSKGELVQTVEEALELTKLNPKYLELEITESVALKESDYIIKELHALKSLGIKLSIDDFGAEYSSLSRLKELPVNNLKIDMEFVKKIGKSVKDKSIVSIIINLAKSLELSVIAEGVETFEEYEFLLQHQCDIIQGYYFYKPLQVGSLEQIFRDEKAKRIG